MTTRLVVSKVRAMNEVVVLTPERILEVTEDVLRRYGLAKATVVDVARALDVSHGSVYRHFPSKASLREAVAKRWLDRASAPLLEIAEATGPAPARLETLAAHDVCDQAQAAGRRSRDVRDLSDAGPRGLQGRQGAQGLPGRSDRAHPVRRREAGRIRGRRPQGLGARHFRRHQPLPSSGPCRRMERSGCPGADRRACWRCCSRAWKRRASAEVRRHAIRRCAVDIPPHGSHARLRHDCGPQRSP